MFHPYIKKSLAKKYENIQFSTKNILNINN